MTIRELLIAPAATGPLAPLVAVLDTAIRCGCAAVLWASFLAMLLPTFANAALRYTTNASLVWSVEVVQLTFPWFVMGGAVLAAQMGRHIGVGLLLALLPPPAVRLLRIAVQCLIVLASAAVIHVYLGFGIYAGGMEFAAGDIAFTSIGVPQSFSYLALLVGYALLGLSALTAAYRIAAEPVAEKP